ncbi:restriction endonuclease subunit S [Pasteurella testudinis]|uniref:restriction endonuclease subunit S n=1 Tax=Pasteurella testudinis TaxID=761 RepID=UPI002447CD10|nr:restriction endonuclease subunit S [Pasteurella testudinis]
MKNTHAWEQRKLGDVVDIIMGQSPDSKNYTDNPNDHILVQGNADIKNGRVSPRVWTTQITKQAKKNDLILSVRAPVGDIAKSDFDVVLGRGVAAIRGSEFIFQTLNKLNNDGYWNRLSSGSTFDSVTSNQVRNAEILFPNLAEQTAIGNFFKQLDEAIASHQRQSPSLLAIKKAIAATAPAMAFKAFSN